MSELKSSYSISELQHRAQLSLRQAGIETASLEARVLLAHVCAITQAGIIAHPDRLIEKKPAQRFLDLVAQRARRMPLAYVLGIKEFWGLEFCVNAQTLIPRPETELAVELAVVCAKSICAQAGSVRILDLGTGTGCVLIAILHEIAGATGIGVDINPQAVVLAQKNAANLGVAGRATFQCRDWGEGLAEKFDIIVSNPPYIQTGDLDALMPEVACHEPVAALDGGGDGLNHYRCIIPQAGRLLCGHGVLILEIGHGQAGDVLNLLGANGFKPRTPGEPVEHDLAGCERIIAAVKVC